MSTQCEEMCSKNPLRLGKYIGEQTFQCKRKATVLTKHGWFCTNHAIMRGHGKAVIKRDLIEKLLSAAFHVLQHDTGEHDEAWRWQRDTLKEKFERILK